MSISRGSQSSRRARNLLFACLPLLSALLLVLWAEHRRIDLSPPPQLYPLQLQSSAELQYFFSEIGYHWPPQRGAAIPPLLVNHLPADLPVLEDSERRKELFLKLLLPVVMAENQRIRQQRRQLLQVLAGDPAVSGELYRRWLLRLAREYRVGGDIRSAAVQRVLLRRVDELPPGLVLAQAAVESGWGTSRFAIEGNNLFGMRTWQSGQGLLPTQRRAGSGHYVRRYGSLRQAVHSYMYNLNSAPAYRLLRQLREGQRRYGTALDAVVLAAGLQGYSERGLQYVIDIQDMIRGNGLTMLNDLEFRSPRDSSVTFSAAATAG
ncbi:MAG: glucosaminidase domain-containing protein [Gammaproteobacteria bacterium]|nr:glucosaminidase domain-containing protein [Gammaproteobacteria bacterium]